MKELWLAAQDHATNETPGNTRQASDITSPANQFRHSADVIQSGLASNTSHLIEAETASRRHVAGNDPGKRLRPWERVKAYVYAYWKHAEDRSHTIAGRSRVKRALGLLCLVVLLCLVDLAWSVSSTYRPQSSPRAAWCASVTALPAPVLSAPSAGAARVKLKDLGNGIEILPLPHPPGWWPVYTPGNRPDHNWMPAGVLSPHVAGTRPCPDKAIATVPIYNSNSAEEQFAIGSDCRVYHRWQPEGGGQFSKWSSLGGCASAHQGLAVGMNGDGELVAFVIAPDHTVWYKSQSKPSLGPWTDWTSIGGDVSTGLRVVSAPNGSSPIQVFANDKSGGRWENEQTQGQGQGNCCWRGWRKRQAP